MFCRISDLHQLTPKRCHRTMGSKVQGCRNFHCELTESSGDLAAWRTGHPCKLPWILHSSREQVQGPAERKTMSLKAGRVDPAATVQAKHPESLVAASGGVTAALLNEWFDRIHSVRFQCWPAAYTLLPLSTKDTCSVSIWVEKARQSLAAPVPAVELPP